MKIPQPIPEQPLQTIKLRPKIPKIKKKQKSPIIYIKSSSSESERLDTPARLR